jgi:nucleoside 2-deoxyribosyltransferase
VERIKEEIFRARFIVADLTDERPSCYFEVGYAEALGRPVIPLASKESVMEPGAGTKIHFDIHQNVRLFTNHEEMAQHLRDAVEKNRKRLLEQPTEAELFPNMLIEQQMATSTLAPHRIRWLGRTTTTF